MKKVILIFPKLGIYDYLVKSIPLSLLSIASYLCKEYEIIIIDQRLTGWQKKLKLALEQKDVLCVGITSCTGKQIQYGLEISKVIKDSYNLPIVWGGIHPTFLPQQTIKSKFVDIVVIGEGEKIFYNLVKSIDEKKDYNDINNIIFKDGQKIVETKFILSDINLDKIPFLPYELVDYKQYFGFSPNYSVKSNITIETGRGCPNKCSYCYNSYKKSWKIMSADRIVSVLLYIKKIMPMIDSITFVDDNFMVNYDRVIKFVNLLKENKIKIKWSCETDLRSIKKLLDNNMLEYLVENGLYWVSPGIETASEKISFEIGKEINFNEIIDINNKLNKYNLYVKYNFMTGYYNETKGDIIKTLSLVNELLKTNNKALIQPLQVCVPYPGTKYLDIAKNYGFEQPKKLINWNNFNPEDWINFVPWLRKKDKNYLKNIFIVSIFIDKKLFINKSKDFFNFVLRFVYRIYYFVAKHRFKHNFFYFNRMENFVFDFVKRILT